MLNKFELKHSAMEATKKVCVQNEGSVDCSKVTRRLKKFCLGYKDLNDQLRSSRLKTVDSKAETNLASSTLSISGELGILQSSMIHYLHNLNKSIVSS